jgi:peptide deformylase
MSIRTILIHPDPRLKKICAPVEGVDPSLRKLADDMIETMYDAPGIGLAAPQIGILQRLFVMDFSAKDDPPAPMALFNPQVIWASDELNTYEEGCLSIPDMYEEVTRPAEVKLRYLDLDGKPQERHLDGLGATCAQHEIDHLNGKLFIDYLSRIKRSMITNKMKKQKKEWALL